MQRLPDPPTLAFLEKARAFPQKSKDFSLRGSPEILGKGRKNAQKKSKENRKMKRARKSKKARIGGSGRYCANVVALLSGEVEAVL